MNEDEESLHGKEKRRKENENLNGRTTEQPSKKRKEDLSTPQLEIKKPSPEKKKVCEFSINYISIKLLFEQSYSCRKCRHLLVSALNSKLFCLNS